MHKEKSQKRIKVGRLLILLFRRRAIVYEYDVGAIRHANVIRLAEQTGYYHLQMMEPNPDR